MARPAKSWLSFVSKYKKNSHRLDDLIYALAISYLNGKSQDLKISDLHQFCIFLVGDSFEYGLVPVETISIENSRIRDIKQIGHTYECWRHLDRPEIQARIQTANKSIDLDLLIGFTQIYTPQWVVDYLIEKTGLSAHSTVLDPACGTGNFILSAFDHINESQQAPVRDILQNQICAVDVDKTALSICALSLAVRLIELDQIDNVSNSLKGFRHIDLDQTEGLGSLYKDFPRDHPLSGSQNVVLTNPPYIGRRLLGKELKEALKKNYPNSYQDLSAAFLDRCLELVGSSGKVGMITQASLLNLPAFYKLRRQIIDQHNLVSIIDAGTKIFPLVTGEKVNSALIVIEKKTYSEYQNNFFEYSKLASGSDKNQVLQDAPVLRLAQESLKSTYRLSEPAPVEVLSLFQLPALENFAAIKQGLATTNNARFVKPICDIRQEDIGKIWFPYVKGAGATRWYAPITHVVDWEDNGSRIKESVRQKYPYLNGKSNWVVKNEAFYFRPGICFSFVSTRGASFRQLPQGAIFDVGASAIFPFDDSIDSDFLLAYLNSSLCVALLQYINPTINNQVGDVRKLPVIPMQQEQQAALSQNAKRLVELSKKKSELCDPTDLDELLIEIEKLELENNSLVLSGAVKHFSWTTAQKTNVENWIGQRRSKKFAPVS